MAARAIVMDERELEELLERAAHRGASRALEDRAANVEPEPEWLDAAGAAELLNVHRDTLRRLGVPTHHVGRRVRYSRSELEAWMRAGRVQKGA